MAVTAKIDEDERLRLKNMLKHERAARRQGHQVIAGLDEAGRGPLAGPIVAAACILPKGTNVIGVNDSKKLLPKAREALFKKLVNDPKIVFAVGIVDSLEIDRINIHQATLQAMNQALSKLGVVPDCLLVDGLNLKHETLPCVKIIKGDQLSQSIAAASIIAKETRDALMREFHVQWPHYGFDQHKGYGTEQHLEALEKHGPCPIHRYSFEPVKSKWSREEITVTITVDEV